MKEYSYAYDIAVVGGGPAGLAAAITAARKGKRVVIVEKNGYLGGNLTIGIPPLGFLDDRSRQCIAGFGEEFIERLKAEGACYGHRYCPKHNSVSNLDAEYVKIAAFEMCREAGVDILLHLETLSVECESGRIKSALFYGKCNKVTISADIFIDCTGDGDLSYLAGCSYEKGRGDKGELMPPTVMCTIEGVDDSKLLDYVEKHPDEMRPMCATIDTPVGYDAAYFKADPNYIFVGMTTLFDKLKKEGKNPVARGNMIVINGVHKGQMYVNTTRLLHVDATDVLDLTRAEIEGHLQLKKLVEVFREYVPGFENCYISSIAPSLGVRETRRFKGVRCVTYQDALSAAVPDDTVCLSGYKIDIHYDGTGGTLFQRVDKPFGVPYGALVSADMRNLLFAGRNISVDEHVIGSTRVMSCCMAMGQAAGLGACMALENSCAPKDVDIAALRSELLNQGAILSME